MKLDTSQWSVKSMETEYFEYKAVFAVEKVTLDAISETAKRRVKHLA